MSIPLQKPVKWDIIPPEINHDHFYYSIIRTLAGDSSIRNVIEIGASSGEGSTEALITGYLENKKRFQKEPGYTSPQIYSIEVCKERYERLESRYKHIQDFHPYNVSSISIEEFPPKETITTFYNTTRTNLNQYPLPLVMSWYDKDLEYISANNIVQNGIELIKKNHNIPVFDIALIDGSEFTGTCELEHLWGAKYIMLDDINAFKNYHTHQKLKASPEYRCITEDIRTRNGFSIFKRCK